MCPKTKNTGIPTQNDVTQLTMVTITVFVKQSCLKLLKLDRVIRDPWVTLREKKICCPASVHTSTLFSRSKFGTRYIMTPAAAPSVPFEKRQSRGVAGINNRGIESDNDKELIHTWILRFGQNQASLTLKGPGERQEGDANVWENGEKVRGFAQRIDAFVNNGKRYQPNDKETDNHLPMRVAKQVDPSGICRGRNHGIYLRYIRIHKLLHFRANITIHNSSYGAYEKSSSGTFQSLKIVKYRWSNPTRRRIPQDRPSATKLCQNSAAGNSWLLLGRPTSKVKFSFNCWQWSVFHQLLQVLQIGWAMSFREYSAMAT